MSGVTNILSSYKSQGDSIFFGPYGTPTWAYTGTKLSSIVTLPVYRVRRDSDNVESDFYVGATLGSLNTTFGGGGTSLSSWLSGANGYLTTVYDPTGGGNHAVQSNTSYQPKIATSGTVEVKNGIPSPYFDGTNDHLTLTSAISGTTPWHVMMIAQREASGYVGPVFGSDAYHYAGWLYSDNNWYALGREGYITSSTSGTLASFSLITTEWISGSYTIYKDGTSLFSGTPISPTTANDFTQVGKRGSDYTRGWISEIILYKADKSASRSSMDTARKTWYGL